jgi:hypothetical protein
VNIEVLGLEHLEVELVVLNLVAAEVLSLGGRRERESRYQRQARYQPGRTGCTPLMHSLFFNLPMHSPARSASLR